MEILRRFIFGDIFHSSDKIDFKMRELITITALATMQTLPQLSAHINGALQAGATPIEIREAMYQLAAFIGFPKTLNAVGIMNDVFKARGIKLPLESMGTVNEKTRFKAWHDIQYPIYGDEIKDKYKDVPDIPKYLILLKI